MKLLFNIYKQTNTDKTKKKITNKQTKHIDTMATTRSSNSIVGIRNIIVFSLLKVNEKKMNKKFTHVNQPNNV